MDILNGVMYSILGDLVIVFAVLAAIAVSVLYAARRIKW